MDLKVPEVNVKSLLKVKLVVPASTVPEVLLMVTGLPRIAPAVKVKLCVATLPVKVNMPAPASNKVPTETSPCALMFPANMPSVSVNVPVTITVSPDATVKVWALPFAISRLLNVILVETSMVEALPVNFTVPPFASKVPPFSTKPVADATDRVIVPVVEWNVPPDKVTVPLMEIALSPPWNTPADWLKLLAATVKEIPEDCVTVPVYPAFI